MHGRARKKRLVDAVILHEGPIDFATLSERVVTSATRYLLLDLDRTIHLGRNMGELLGWELGALRAYGPEELARMEPERGTGRLIFDPKRPLGSLRYLAMGAQSWALPGLYYLFFGKIPAMSDRLLAWTFRGFGPDPMRRIQRVPQRALLELLADVPERTLRELAERVWDRHTPDQVIDREDLDRLRERCPDLEIVITSASPRAVVEVARERLGADFAECSEPGRINSGPAKIERLRELLPEALDPRVESVGISDTSHGEDHCWADHFTRVVDVNSDAPFSPLVDVRSPLLEVHSAQLATRRERELRGKGEPEWIDARRGDAARPVFRAFRERELIAIVDDLLDQADALALAPEENAWPLMKLMRDARRRLEEAARTSTERAIAIGTQLAPA